VKAVLHTEAKTAIKVRDDVKVMRCVNNVTLQDLVARHLVANVTNKRSTHIKPHGTQMATASRYELN
jgi:hypothetical protein